jgi:hypothetical protein
VRAAANTTGVHWFGNLIVTRDGESGFGAETRIRLASTFTSLISYPSDNCATRRQSNGVAKVGRAAISTRHERGPALAGDGDTGRGHRLTIEWESADPSQRSGSREPNT